MKEITFNEKQYQIPENWNEITLKMVIDVDTYANSLEDAEVLAIIAGYTGIPLSELKESRIGEINEIMSIMNFIYEPYVPVPNNTFEFRGVKYGTKEEIEETEFQDWISIQTILYRYKDNPVLGLHKMIAVLCKKDGESLDDFDVEERAKMFLELPLPIAKDVEGFFLTSLVALNATSLLFSTIPEQQQIVLAKFSELDSIMKSRSQERGTSLLMKFQIGLLRYYLKFIRQGLEKSFNTKVTEYSKRNWIATYKQSLIKKFSGNK